MKTKINKTKTASQKMSKPSTKEFLNKFKATGKELPVSTIQEREAKAEEELDNIPYETKSKWEDNITEDSKRNQRYLFFDVDNSDSDTGTLDELPYWIDENKSNMTYDSNANTDQTEMNESMQSLMEASGIGIGDLPLELSYNMESDGMLSFGSAEEDMPKNSLPISHNGDDGEYEGQYDDISQMKSVAGAEGVSDQAFKKWFEDSYPTRDGNLYYDRYQATKGVRSETKLPIGEMFGFKQWDKVRINNQIGFVKGKRSSGFFDVCDIDKNNISHSVKYTNLQRLCSTNVMEVQAVPLIIKTVGVLA